MLQEFPDLGNYHVLDLGGTARSWLRSPVRPASVTLLNLFNDELGTNDDEPLPDEFHLVAGDACDPPTEILSGTFDLVYSNSVIEHVGGAFRRQAFADVVHHVAPRAWIQTPYRYFPIEPHWLFPGFQFLPLDLRAVLSRRWPLIHTKSNDWRSSVGTALAVELQSVTEMRYLFADSEILYERMAGLVKSVVAVRRVVESTA